MAISVASEIDFRLMTIKGTLITVVLLLLLVYSIGTPSRGHNLTTTTIARGQKSGLRFPTIVERIGGG